MIAAKAHPATHYTILLYHGVYPDDLDIGLRNSSGKHVPRSRFEAEIRHLSTHHPIVTMRAIAAAHRGEHVIPDNAVAVTFDDGFRNNFDEAWPILERYRVPATFYLATGYIGGARMIWTDRLEDAILTTQESRIRFSDDGDACDYTLSDELSRVKAFTAIKKRCKRLPTVRKDEIVDAICLALSHQPHPDHCLYSFLDWKHVQEMASSPLIHFGAHTVDHVTLTRTSESEMRRQIDQSLAAVSTTLEARCDLFSYPEGMPGDYNDTVIDHLRRCGLDHAPSALPGINNLSLTNPFHLHRIAVGMDGLTYPFSAL